MHAPPDVNVPDTDATISSTEPVANAIDAQRPWLGLASFTEETRSYFFGREEEIAELARRVQRKLLTVLFGQSGLGKTSILRAGVVPKLRALGYCPVYVRIDYTPQAPPPSEQIKQAIYRTARSAGQWTQPGVALPDETPWEFLHHRDDVLHDAGGAPLIPLLIFDQFEEVFTLAQSDDAGRQRAARFLEDLADLVENRPPKTLEARFESDDAWAEKFDFARSDYRVLIALREDYLAHLEALKSGMPSVTQNRMRLAPMTGEQALAAVTGPGGALVTPEVAAAIVRFVAGGAELRNAEVEPSLLSLICRELNDARIAAGRSEISIDLLEGTRAGILSEFYERALADQPAAVRRVIEDQLLTDSGFRENVAEERLLRDFAAAGAAPGALAVLVDRRLLRIEERLDVRRVELTHDVLCEVVRASRDLRQEREARAATEREIAQQRERELSARGALVRARYVALVCGVLALGAVGASVYAYFSAQRAVHAEQQARLTGLQADLARGQAEGLIAYLMDDFTDELEPIGQKSVIGELDRRVVDYYRSLPESLQGPATERNRALAMVAYASSLDRQSKLKEARPVLTEALGILEKLRSAGDVSEATTIGLARGLGTEADLNSRDLEGDVIAVQKRSVDLLDALASRDTASEAAKRAQGAALYHLGYFLIDGGRDAEAAAALGRAMQVLAGIGATDLSNPPAAHLFAAAAGWRVTALNDTGNPAEARRVGAQGLQVASALLARRPGHLLALYDRSLIYDSLAEVDSEEQRLTAALQNIVRGKADLTQLAALDPSNQTSWNNLGAAWAGMGANAERMGDSRRAAEYFLASTQAIRQSPHNNAFSLRNEVYSATEAARLLADLGDDAASDKAMALATQLRDAAAHDAAFKGGVPVDVECLINNHAADIHLLRQQPEAALARARAVVDAMAARAAAGAKGPIAGLCKFYGETDLGEAAFERHDLAGAEAALRAALATDTRYRMDATVDAIHRAPTSVLLAMSLARQGKGAEAQHVIAPVVELLRGEARRGQEDRQLRLTLASALYAQALAEPAGGSALLQEADALITALPASMQGLHTVSTWRQRIAAERRGTAGGELPTGAQN